MTHDALNRAKEMPRRLVRARGTAASGAGSAVRRARTNCDHESKLPRLCADLPA